MGTKRNQMDATFDAALQLKDAGAVSADGAGTVGGQARVVNVGTGLISATLIADIAELDLAGGDEGYRIVLQGSTDPTFATNVSNLVEINGGVAATAAGEDSFGIGRVARGFNNVAENGDVLPYLRVFSDITAGAGTGSINYQAFIAQRVLP
jgi:hypothetical protein